MNTSCSDETGIWLGIHFHNLAVEVFTRGQAETDQTPIVVTERQRVLAMNTAAALLGIRPGSSMDTAYTLAERIVSFERNVEKEIAALTQLAQWAYQFTPHVAIRAPDCIVLDITGCLRLWQGLDALRTRISDGVAGQGFSASFGVGRTPGAALCLARASTAGYAVSSDLNQPVQKALADLPVDCLAIEKKISESLGQMGIRNIGGLLSLPPAGVRKRFGTWFANSLAQLTGEVPSPQKFIDETPRFFSEITFIPEITNLDALVFPVRRMLDELSEFLTGRQLHINRFTFRLSHRGHAPREFSVYMASPENDPGMFRMLTQLQLDKINDLPEVDTLTLTARVFYPAESASGDLFHGTRFRKKDGRVASASDRDNANRLINMLRARLGPDTCFGLSEANDHRPEHAWRAIRLSERDYWSFDGPNNERPLYLLAEPRPLTVINNVPVLDGRLDLIRGPERIDSGWWDGNDSARDYFVARKHGGSLYWVFRHAMSGRWYLHGVFS